MLESEDSLRYEKYIAPYRCNGVLTGDAERDAYWHHQAQHQHVLSVIDAVATIQLDIVVIGQKVSSASASNHLLFGAARRSRMIWGALRQLYGLVPPDREEPLPNDDVFEASRALNDIYIHTLGMLDNYAWSVAYQFGDENLFALHQNDVSLFKSRFRSNPSVSDFARIAADFSDWNSEIKQRRDPVAHRIPLSVPPAVLNEHDQVEYGKLSREADSAYLDFVDKVKKRSGASEVEAASTRWENLMNQMSRLGRFVPIIVHDPNDGGTPIYPTVPHDVGQLVLLSWRLNAKFAQRLEE